MTRSLPAFAALALIAAPTARAQEDAAPASTSESAQVKKLLEKYKTEPTVRDVQEAAGRYAEVHPEVLQSWRSRARSSMARSVSEDARSARSG